MTNETKLPSLKAMAEGKVEGVQKATYFKVDPDRVEFEEGFNLREEGPELDSHLEAMYEAMKAGAYFPPIDVSVVDGRIIARDGHCRTRTARRLKAEGIDYLLEARQFRGNEAECVFHMLGSAQGKALTPLEAGRGYKRLVRYGLTVAEICRRTGLSRTTVDNGIILADAPVEVQKMLVDGSVSVQVVLETLAKHGSKAVEVLAGIVGKAKEAGVSRVTKKHVVEYRVPKSASRTFLMATRSIRKAYETSTHAELMAMDDDAMIPIPARAFKELVYALVECGDIEVPASTPANQADEEL